MDFVQLRFKELREKLKLTQVEISERLGMNQVTWQKLESGKTPDPRASTIAHICKTFNIDANWLLGLKE